jgi:hypothetical protein
MFRLLKLMAFALFGYALYEFVRGMNDAAGSGGSGRGTSGRTRRSEAFGEESGHGQLTGSGEGRVDETLDPDGGSVRHRVGRGAVSR